MGDVRRGTAHTDQQPLAAPGWVHVVDYDDVEDLRADAMRYARRVTGEPLTDQDRVNFAGAWALFQGPSYGATFDDDGYVTEPPDRYAGVIRLTPHTDVGIVLHEAVHAGWTIYNRQHRDRLTDTGPIADEEVLAYTVQHLYADVVHTLASLRGVASPFGGAS